MAGTENVRIALAYARTLEGTPYQWWSGDDLRGDKAPFWAHSARAPSSKIVKAQSCTCTGLINLMRRKVGLPVPGLDRPDYPFAGGTWCWFNYLKRKAALQTFDIDKTYPKGTLLLRPFKNELDQGHVAVVCTDNSEHILYAKLIHSYSQDPNPQLGKRGLVGVKIDGAVGMSHFWRPTGFYTHACLPKGWLS